MKDEVTNKIPKKQWWKIATFTLGIILIAAAATYAVTQRGSAASSVSLDNVQSPGSAIVGSAPGITVIGDLKWAQNLPAKFTDHNFIFVILPGNDSNSNAILSKRVSDASAKIEARGVHVETTTLSPDDPELSITLKRLAIGQLPAVLAITNTGSTRIVTGDITEGTLLQTYVIATQPVCVPGGSSGCCGGGSSSGTSSGCCGGN